MLNAILSVRGSSVHHPQEREPKVLAFQQQWMGLCWHHHSFLGFLLCLGLLVIYVKFSEGIMARPASQDNPTCKV